MQRNEFQEWLRLQKAQRAWSLEKIRQKGGPVPSRMTGFLKHGMKPTRENSDRIASAFGHDPDDVWAMVTRSFGSPARQPGFDNIEYLSPDDYTPEEAALIARVLGGVAEVFRAKARGEA